MLAGLAADGTTVVGDAHHVERGYADLVASLSFAGRDVDWEEPEHLRALTARRHGTGLKRRHVVETAVQEALDAIRPALQADGGDMRILSLDEVTGVLDVELMGACGSCPMSTMTLKQGVERILKDRVEGLTEVRAKGIDFDVDPSGF